MLVLARMAAVAFPPALAVLAGVSVGAFAYGVGLRMTGAVGAGDAIRLSALERLLPGWLRWSYGRAIALVATPERS